MKRTLLAVVSAALMLAAPAGAAIIGGPTERVFGPATGDDEHVPNITSLSAATAGGRHVAAILDIDALYSGDPANLFGQAIKADGKPVGEPQPWSTDKVAYSAYAAVNGDTGVAVWLVDTDEANNNYSLMMRRFDAETAEPLGEPQRLGLTTDLYDIQAYRDGYLLAHEIGQPRAISVDQLTTLDREGQPVGEPRVLKEGRGRFYPLLYPSASAQRLLMLSTFGSSLAIERFKPDGTSAARRTGGIDDEYLYDAAHAAGGTWMTAWSRESDNRLYLRRTTSNGTLGPVHQTGLRARGLADLRYNDGKGLLIVHSGKRGCRFSATRVDAKGRTIGKKGSFELDCGGDRASPRYAHLVPGAPGRFLYAFTAFNRGAEHSVYATRIRVK